MNPQTQETFGGVRSGPPCGCTPPSKTGTDGMCHCPVGSGWVASIDTCVPFLDRYHDNSAPQVCPFKAGNPIYPLTGSKSLTESFGSWSLARQSLTAVYDTRRKVRANDQSLVFTAVAPISFGELWTSSLHKSLVLQANGATQVIQAARGSGAWSSFVRDASGNYTADADTSGRLIAITGGWRYLDATLRSQETYDSAGTLQSVQYANGTRLDYAYSTASTPSAVAPVAGLLITIQDHTGRGVQFLYEQSVGVNAPRIRQITDHSGQNTVVGYDADNNLSQLSWPDGKTRQYLYERGDLPWAVTGVVDENAKRLATYAYDSQGRAIDTQWAGGADHYSATYTTPPSWNVAETYDSTANILWRDYSWQLPQGLTLMQPNGSTSSIGATLIQGTPYLTSQTQPAGSGCTASTSHQSFDANGNLSSRDDFNGTRSCYANDVSRNLEITRVEGLSQSTDCSTVTTVNATLSINSRKTSTEWHPDWRLSTKVAEPGRITTSIYNGQPDPFNGGAVASCAPSTALLPDGKPIAVLCKQVEQATTDTDGHLGFSAALQSGVASRQTSWTYNQYGQVLTEDGPRTDVNDVTTYTYYSDTTADHTLGDLQSSTNAAGKVTSYSKYNKHGQVLESTDANGVLSVNTYDLRQRLLSSSVGGQTTSYSYDAAGQLKKVTLPDTSWVGYDYDDAHRQVAVYDNKGNRTEYQLDNAGNRTGETTKDPGGNLKRQLTRSIDALGRVQQTTGRE